MRDLKGSSLTDRLAAAAEAKAALLAKMKPKPTVTDPLFAEREAMRPAELQDVRAARAGCVARPSLARGGLPTAMAETRPGRRPRPISAGRSPARGGRPLWGGRSGKRPAPSGPSRSLRMFGAPPRLRRNWSKRVKP